MASKTTRITSESDEICTANSPTFNDKLLEWNISSNIIV